MSQSKNISSRKTDHIRITLEKDVVSLQSNGLEKYSFHHCALPDLDFKELDTSIFFLNKLMKIPLLISSMTGGTTKAAKFNQVLASAAQHHGIAMGVGSQRAGIEVPLLMETFKVRRFAPDIPLFANLGAVQLNYSYGVEHCQRVVDALEADALLLHLNPLQEVLQPDGNTNFSGLLLKIEKVCQSLNVPVIVKEVGWGISAEVAAQLSSAGVVAIDVAGAGGTSWSEVEKYRGSDEKSQRIAGCFRDWGIDTATSIKLVRKAVPRMAIIASGGITNGIEIAKCIALGASMAGMARRFLVAANQSSAAVDCLIDEIHTQLKICMFVVGAQDIESLKRTPLYEK